MPDALHLNKIIAKASLKQLSALSTYISVTSFMSLNDIFQLYSFNMKFKFGCPTILGSHYISFSIFYFRYTMRFYMMIHAMPDKTCCLVFGDYLTCKELQDVDINVRLIPAFPNHRNVNIVLIAYACMQGIYTFFSLQNLI